MFDSSANKNRLLLILSLIALLFGLRVNTWYRTHQATTLSFSGIMIQKPLVVPAFELQDEAKQRFTQKNLHGQYNFLFFGYTHCRGICSLTMMKLTELYKQIQIKKLPIPRILFISLDPKHDKPAILRNYVQAFHPAFKGLTGSSQSIQQLSQQMGVVYIRSQEDKQNSQEEINHIGALYLVNPKGQLILIFSPPHEKSTLLQDYQHLTQN